MELAELLKLGFNKNEAKVYLSLIRFGKADARQIINDTKFHKNIVYDNLEKLIDRGLISFIIEGKKRLFQVSSSDSLINLFEEKASDIEEKKQLATKLSKEITIRAKSLPNKREALVFRGVKGVKTFYNESLEKGEDFVVFGGPEESVNIMGELFWKNYDIKRAAKKISVRMIFNPSLREYGKNAENKFTEIRYFKRDFEPLTETHIQGDSVAVIVWTEEPVIFVMKDKLAADSYRKFFEDMWKQAKK